MRSSVISGMRFGVAALALASAAPALASTEPVTGDPVLYWHEVLQTGLTGSPTVQSRGYAMVSVALHDAVNAALGRPNAAYVPGIDAQGGDIRAAAAVAAHRVLVHLNPTNSTNVANFDAALAASLALVTDNDARLAGMATGAAIAAAVIANRTGDGSALGSTYLPSGLPGRWAPTSPGVPAAVPQYADVKPWFMTSPEQFRAAPPPAIDSAAYAFAFNEVKSIGVAGSGSGRSDDQTLAALFWAGANGTGPWVRAAIDKAQGSDLSTLEKAAMLARLSTGIADATIATWDTKYHFDYWRPVTAIRAAGGDLGAWTPLIVTPSHPSYLSAHAAVAGAGSTILESVFGFGGNFCITASANTRCWNGFAAAAGDAADSRLWGGIHWRFDNENGLALGKDVGRFSLASTAFRAVPEPSVWLMMIAGFGMIGALMRGGRYKSRARQVA